MSEFNHYKAALYLCAATVLTEAVWILLFINPRTPQDTRLTVIILVATFVILLGLLVQSNLIRYVGAVLMAAWGGGLLWGVLRGIAPLFRSTPTYILVFLLLVLFYYLISSALNLLTAAVLLFSKQFAYEFAERRNSAPRYIAHLRLLLIGAIVAATAICTPQTITAGGAGSKADIQPRTWDVR